MRQFPPHLPPEFHSYTGEEYPHPLLYSIREPPPPGSLPQQAYSQPLSVSEEPPALREAAADPPACEGNLPPHSVFRPDPEILLFPLSFHPQSAK